MFICQNSEGVHANLLKWCMGTCSFGRMLKRYMVRKRLGTPAIEEWARRIEVNNDELSLFLALRIGYCYI